MNWTLQTWSYAATIDGGKYLDAAAYYSSYGLVHGRVLAAGGAVRRGVYSLGSTGAPRSSPPTRTGGPGSATRCPSGRLLALYRGTFFYGVSRLVTWTLWAHVFARPEIDGKERVGYPFDLSWTGPWWIGSRSLPHVNPWIVAPTAIGLLFLVYWAVSRLWEPMGRAEEAKRRRQRTPVG